MSTKNFYKPYLEAEVETATMFHNFAGSSLTISRITEAARL